MARNLAVFLAALTQLVTRAKARCDPETKPGGNEEEFTDVMNIESLDLVRCRKVTERALGYANCMQATSRMRIKLVTRMAKKTFSGEGCFAGVQDI